MTFSLTTVTFPRPTFLHIQVLLLISLAVAVAGTVEFILTRQHRQLHPHHLTLVQAIYHQVIRICHQVTRIFHHKVVPMIHLPQVQVVVHLINLH